MERFGEREISMLKLYSAHFYGKGNSITVLIGNTHSFPQSCSIDIRMQCWKKEKHHWIRFKSLKKAQLLFILFSFYITWGVFNVWFGSPLVTLNYHMHSRWKDKQGRTECLGGEIRSLGGHIKIYKMAYKWGRGKWQRPIKDVQAGREANSNNGERRRPAW